MTKDILEIIFYLCRKHGCRTDDVTFAQKVYDLYIKNLGTCSNDQLEDAVIFYLDEYNS